MHALIQLIPQSNIAIMQQANFFYLLPCYFFLAGGLLGCSGLIQSSLNALNITAAVDVARISEIKPEHYNQTVYLQGKVTKQVPLLEQHVYQLEDSTGTIWVLTNQTPAQLQEQVLIKGLVRYQSIPLAGQEYGEVYVEEQTQIERKPA